MNIAKNQSQEYQSMSHNDDYKSSNQEYNLTVDTAFDYFISQYGGEMRSLLSSYIRGSVSITLDRFVLGYLNRCQSTIAIYLMIEDKDFVAKLVDFLKK